MKWAYLLTGANLDYDYGITESIDKAIEVATKIANRFRAKGDSIKTICWHEIPIEVALVNSDGNVVNSIQIRPLTVFDD